MQIETAPTSIKNAYFWIMGYHAHFKTWPHEAVVPPAYSKAIPELLQMGILCAQTYRALNGLLRALASTTKEVEDVDAPNLFECIGKLKNACKAKGREFKSSNKDLLRYRMLVRTFSAKEVLKCHEAFASIEKEPNMEKFFHYVNAVRLKGKKA